MNRPEKTEIYFGKQAEEVLRAHNNMMKMHYKVLACHCECMGMNGENAAASCKGAKIPFGEVNYKLAMEKWGIVDKEGKPIL